VTGLAEAKRKGHKVFVTSMCVGTGQVSDHVVLLAANMLTGLFRRVLPVSLSMSSSCCWSRIVVWSLVIRPLWNALKLATIRRMTVQSPAGQAARSLHFSVRSPQVCEGSRTSCERPPSPWGRYYVKLRRLTLNRVPARFRRSTHVQPRCFAEGVGRCLAATIDTGVSRRLGDSKVMQGNWV
jgi:hypothetical protein